MAMMIPINSNSSNLIFITDNIWHYNPRPKPKPLIAKMLPRVFPLKESLNYKVIFWLITQYKFIQEIFLNPLQEGNEHFPLRVLDLLCSRIKVWETSLITSKYMLEFTKNQNTFELYFNNENIIEYWLECLKPICIFTKLETHYIPIHFFENNYSFSNVIFLLKSL